MNAALKSGNRRTGCGCPMWLISLIMLGVIIYAIIIMWMLCKNCSNSMISPTYNYNYLPICV
jgi:hypothetical protein